MIFRSIGNRARPLGIVLLVCFVIGAADTSRGQDEQDNYPSPEQVQSAIDGGLRWLARTQVKDGPEAGAWRCSNQRYTPAVTSLAGLAFLANGYLPDRGEYGGVIRAALDYVVDQMGSGGYMGQGDPSGMYIHAISAAFGLSCFGELQDAESEAKLADWCADVVNLIIEAQQVSRSPVARGGWRYTPRTNESDASTTSWQLLVLHAARQCGFDVPEEVIERGLAYINRAYTEGKGDEPTGFLYRAGISQEPDPSVTAVAVAVKSILEGQIDERAAKILEQKDLFQPTWGGTQYGGYFYFSLFYMTQGMFQSGGEEWETFRPDMEKVLVEHQTGEGDWPFPPDNMRQSRAAGPAYSTAMAVLVLALDRQYLPMYQRQRPFFHLRQENPGTE
ncbi:MAG: prenyltransferase/squalene oxidase repeat-containing protein [bacterium]